MFGTYRARLARVAVCCMYFHKGWTLQAFQESRIHWQSTMGMPWTSNVLQGNHIKKGIIVPRNAGEDRLSRKEKRKIKKYKV